MKSGFFDKIYHQARKLNPTSDLETVDIYSFTEQDERVESERVEPRTRASQSENSGVYSLNRPLTVERDAGMQDLSVSSEENAGEYDPVKVPGRESKSDTNVSKGDSHVAVTGVSDEKISDLRHEAYVSVSVMDSMNQNKSDQRKEMNVSDTVSDEEKKNQQLSDLRRGVTVSDRVEKNSAVSGSIVTDISKTKSSNVVAGKETSSNEGTHTGPVFDFHLSSKPPQPNTSLDLEQEFKQLNQTSAHERKTQPAHRQTEVPQTSPTTPVQPRARQEKPNKAMEQESQSHAEPKDISAQNTRPRIRSFESSSVMLASRPSVQTSSKQPSSSQQNPPSPPPPNRKQDSETPRNTIQIGSIEVEIRDEEANKKKSSSESLRSQNSWRDLKWL